MLGARRLSMHTHTVGSRYPENLSGLTMICLDNETLHVMAYKPMDQLHRTFFSKKKIMGLDIRTNTGIALIFRITRPPIFRIG
jgi:hypothetical protein